MFHNSYASRISRGAIAALGDPPIGADRGISRGRHALTTHVREFFNNVTRALLQLSYIVSGIYSRPPRVSAFVSELNDSAARERNHERFTIGYARNTLAGRA